MTQFLHQEKKLVTVVVRVKGMLHVKHLQVLDKGFKKRVSFYYSRSL